MSGAGTAGVQMSPRLSSFGRMESKLRPRGVGTRCGGCVCGVQDPAKEVPEQSQDRTVLEEATGPEMMV